MHKVLKFSYFLSIFLFISCGEHTAKVKSEGNTNTLEPIEKNEVASNVKTILFFGNSLTAAYGLKKEEGFPHQIQLKLDSLGLSYNVINSGLSGETTSGGLNRLDWVLNQKVDVFVLELGANDGLRGIPLQKTMNNLQTIIDKVKEKNADTQIILAGMQIPPNMGADYTTQFKNIFPTLEKENDISLIPFLLEGVAGNPELNLEDGIHPTAEGQKIVAKNVWAVLEKVLVKEESGVIN